MINCLGCKQYHALLTIAEPSTVYVQCNTAPLGLYKTLLFNHIPVILIPCNVSLSKTVTQSLPRSLSLSICQSAVSHSLIQSVPRFSVCQSAAHSVTPSLSPYLHTSLPPHSLTCTFSLSITVHILVVRFLTVSSMLWSAFLSTRETFNSHVLCFVEPCRGPCTSDLFSVLFSLAWSNSFSFCHSPLLLLCFMPLLTLLTPSFSLALSASVLSSCSCSDYSSAHYL